MSLMSAVISSTSPLQSEQIIALGQLLVYYTHQGYSQFEWLLSSMAQNRPACNFTNELRSIDSDAIMSGDMFVLQVSLTCNSILLFSKSMDKSILTVIGEGGVHIGQISLHETSIEGMVKASSVSSSETHIVLNYDSEPNRETLIKAIEGFNNADVAGTKLVITSFPTQRVDAIVCDFNVERVVNGLSNGIETPARKHILFSLAENGSLFANERRLARNCTSFLVTPAHLIFTTSQHLLKFVHLTRDSEGEFPLAQYLRLCSNNIFNRPRDTSRYTRIR